MALSKIQKDVLDYIRSTFSDISPKTVDIYTDKISHMTDNQIIQFFKDGGVRLFVDDKHVTQPLVDKLVKKMNVVKEENIVFPFKGNASSMQKYMVFPMQIRRLQQVVTTESKSNLDASVRDKANQAVRESKTSKLTDSEVAIMASVGLDNTLSELLSPRSDNQLGKQEMNRLIREHGTFSMKDIPKTPTSRSSVLYLDALYKSMGVATDLVDNIDDTT